MIAMSVRRRGLTCLLSLTALLTGTAAWPQGDSILIVDVTVISPERETPLADADVVIRDGRIARIGRSRSRNASLPQMLLLAGNPLADVSAYDSIETIVLNGQPIARETLRPHERSRRRLRFTRRYSESPRSRWQRST
jgi:hypothetical protein